MKKFDFTEYQRKRELYYKNIEDIINGLKATPERYTIISLPNSVDNSTFHNISIYYGTEKVLSIETCESYFTMCDPQTNMEITVRANTDVKTENVMEYAIYETYSEKEDAMVGINVFFDKDGVHVAERYCQEINIIDDEEGHFLMRSMVDELTDEDGDTIEADLLDDDVDDEEVELEDDIDDEEISFDIEDLTEYSSNTCETFGISQNGTDITRDFSIDEISDIIRANVNLGEQITDDFDYTLSIIKNLRNQIRIRLRDFKKQNIIQENKEKYKIKSSIVRKI